MVFTPAASLLDGSYTVDVQLEDNVGNKGPAVQYGFTLDTTPPPEPELNPVTTPTQNARQTIQGIKEAYASILLNGEEVVGHTADTIWQYTVTLQSGTNTLSFIASDRAGNESAVVTAEIVYDDTPPLAVANLNAHGDGVGNTVALDWTGYNESTHGDIDFYRVYVANAF